jgi:hypothetical protein
MYFDTDCASSSLPSDKPIRAPQEVVDGLASGAILDIQWAFTCPRTRPEVEVGILVRRTVECFLQSVAACLARRPANCSTRCCVYCMNQFRGIHSHAILVIPNDIGSYICRAIQLEIACGGWEGGGEGEREREREREEDEVSWNSQRCL